MCRIQAAEQVKHRSSNNFVSPTHIFQELKVRLWTTPAMIPLSLSYQDRPLLHTAIKGGHMIDFLPLGALMWEMCRIESVEAVRGEIIEVGRK